MKNSYKCGELVRVNGIGKKIGKVDNRLGFILDRDGFFKDYYIDLISGESDWFNSKDIEKVMEEKVNKRNKYQVRLCTTKMGYDLIRKKIQYLENTGNNKFNKINIYKKFQKDNLTYVIIGWKSTTWPVSNKSIMVLENTLQDFKKQKIPFQYVVLNENILTDIKVEVHSDNDKNVEVFSIERKIKTNKLK